MHYYCELEKVEDILPLGTMFFQHMPTDIWGVDGASFLDEELILQIGGLPASGKLIKNRLTIESFAKHVYTKYNDNWRKAWQALMEEYNLFITSNENETFTSTVVEDRDIDRLVSRDTTENATAGTDRLTANTNENEDVNSGEHNNVDQTSKYGLGSPGGVGNPDSRQTSTGTSSGNVTSSGSSSTTDELTETREVVTDNTETDTTGIDATVTTTEERNREGSSPLRTYQALLNEELDGRSGVQWNIFQLIINNTRNELALKIWQ